MRYSKCNVCVTDRDKYDVYINIHRYINIQYILIYTILHIYSINIKCLLYIKRTAYILISYHMYPQRYKQKLMFVFMCATFKYIINWCGN